VTQSPIELLLGAIDSLDVDAVMALLADDCQLLTADGRRAHGHDAVRELLTSFVGDLRSAAHRVTDQWQSDDVWIAEVEVTYELRDWLQLNALPRAFVVRSGSDGISEVHVYGAHERRLGDHPTGEEGMWIGDRWIPPL
jgi:SnoaL-like domain